MNQHLYVVQINDSYPHQVKVSRRTVPKFASYESVEGTVRSLLREGYTLCNWHLFEVSPENEGDNEETFQAKAFAI